MGEEDRGGEWGRQGKCKVTIKETEGRDKPWKLNVLAYH